MDWNSWGIVVCRFHRYCGSSHEVETSYEVGLLCFFTMWDSPVAVCWSIIIIIPSKYNSNSHKPS